MKCYYASFNVGNVEVWSSELFLKKKSVLIEVEESIEEIAEEISIWTFLSETEIAESLNRAIKILKRHGIYKDKENNFDFFILEQYVWKDIQDREIFMSKLKIDDDGAN